MTETRESRFLGALAAAGVEEGAREKLAVFLALLGRFERVTDLRGPGAVGRAVESVLGALAGASFLAGVGRFVDVGSGNGLPAIPLLIARPEMGGVLLEPRERRWAFLREVVREVGVEADVRRERAEDHRGGPYQALTCRGVGAWGWVGVVGRLVEAGGGVLWWGGEWGGEVEPGERVLPSPLATPGGSLLHVWRRCST